MPKFIIVFLILFCIKSVYAQTDEKYKDGSGFNSVFQKLDSGNFSGTTNGVISIEIENGSEVILDFQGSFGALLIVKDSNEIYDVSTKSYNGKTTSGKTEIRYETYALANGIGIKLNGQWFQLTAIDGASDMVVNGIKYSYKAEANTEYLVLFINKEITLSNWQYLIQTEYKNDNIEELKKKKKNIKILPNSTITFAIKRK